MPILLAELALTGAMGATAGCRTGRDYMQEFSDITGSVTVVSDRYSPKVDRFMIDDSTTWSPAVDIYDQSETRLSASHPQTEFAKVVREAAEMLALFSGFPVDDDAQERFDAHMVEANRSLVHTARRINRRASQ